MSEQLKEALSAVVDGEADVFELRRVLDEVGRSTELSAAWRRYHLIGEHLRGERGTLAESTLNDMADQVWSGLEEDAALGEQGLQDEALAQTPRVAALHSVPGTAAGGQDPQSGAPLKRWAPVAVAASVALMVTLGFFGLQDAEQAPVFAADTIEIEGPVFQLATEVSPSDIQRANAYMLHHVQQKALNQPGVASFVKVVTFEKTQ
ncbi:MAG: sigma-E factor negative regulatory protein [Pseudomonadales bacterium]